MREEDKVLILAEILGIDTSKYVEQYVEEIRSSDVFLELCNNVHRARTSDSYKAQNLIDEFESIDFSLIKSLQECFIVSSKINYLLKISLESDYINPFFYNEESDIIEKVGEISVTFDSKNYTLNDIILDERYTTSYKIDYFKDCYLEWRKEVVNKIIDPLNLLLIHQKKLPKFKIFDFSLIAIILIILLSNLAFFIAPFVPSHFIKTLYTQNCDNLFIMIIFDIDFILLFINNVLLIFMIYFRYLDKGKYIRARKILKKPLKIITSINHQCEKFYAYLMKCLSDNKLLSKKINKYNLNKNYVSSIGILMRLKNNQNQVKIKDNNIPFIFRLTFVLFIVVSMILLCYLLYLLWRKSL